MPIVRFSRFLPLTIVFALTGCGHSPATHFYTLDATAPRATPASPAPVLRVDQVQVPSVLDRPELVHEYAQGQLKVDDFSHWGAPLGQLMRATLSQDLAARLPSGNLLPAGGPRPPGAIGISVEIISVGTSGSDMSMDVVWTTTTLTTPVAGQPGTPPVVTPHTTRLTTQASASDPAAYAAGLSSLMGDLADQIVATAAAR